jgi:hypothetical protein
MISCRLPCPRFSISYPDILYMNILYEYPIRYAYTVFLSVRRSGTRPRGLRDDEQTGRLRFHLKGKADACQQALVNDFPPAYPWLIPDFSPAFPRLIPYLSPIYPSKPPLLESSKISGMIRQWYLFGLSRALNRYLQSSYTEEGDHAFSDHQK